MKELNWKRKPAYFYCPVCKKWIDDSVVTLDGCHDLLRGGCNCFVMTQADVQALSAGASRNG